MRSAFGFDHRIDEGHIRVPGAPDITVHDTGSAYVTPCAFVPKGAPRPARVHSPRTSRAVPYPGQARASQRERCDSAAGKTAVECLAWCMTAVGKSQATLFHQLGFPYAEQWKQVPGVRKLLPSTLSLRLRRAWLTSVTLAVYRTPCSRTRASIPA